MICHSRRPCPTSIVLTLLYADKDWNGSSCVINISITDPDLDIITVLNLFSDLMPNVRLRRTASMPQALVVLVCIVSLRAIRNTASATDKALFNLFTIPLSCNCMFIVLHGSVFNTSVLFLQQMSTNQVTRLRRASYWIPE